MLRLIRLEKARRAKEAERQRVERDGELIRERCSTLAGFVRERGTFWSLCSHMCMDGTSTRCASI
ncbi:hypothetical protein G3A56_00015 [Rhizobium oryzihabitans]|uniref:Uncharacterized protein n=1 Tax=Rhizobium oryzihabitans TaxID=2267833 RepID=A0A7L5BCK2_9HYPH|nr:hypothetical protein [Rhizobium oryzihabitans]QIB36587.1 hypothetical protein G3A56_00015 [Rhizobium oryzihabitans]